MPLSRLVNRFCQHAASGIGGGFTLIELLVAISVLGIISVLGWRGLDSIVRTRESLNRELEQARGLQIALAQWQTDCANAVDAAMLDGHPPLVIDSTRMTLARRVQAEGQPGALQLITWRVRDNALMREESPPTRDLSQLDPWWQVAQAASAPPGVRLQKGVRSLGVRVWANDGRGWRSWDSASSALSSRAALMNPDAGSTSTQILWRGVEVSLKLEDRSAPLAKIFMLGAM